MLLLCCSASRRSGSCRPKTVCFAAVTLLFINLIVEDQVIALDGRIFVVFVSYDRFSVQYIDSIHTSDFKFYEGSALDFMRAHKPQNFEPFQPFFPTRLDATASKRCDLSEP